MVHSTLISGVAPAGGYRIDGAVNGVKTSFLLDTGATVTLVRADVWTKSGMKEMTLQPYAEQKLVSVNGSPLNVHGQGRAELDLAGKQLQLDVVVVSPLTVEAILGLDFLQQHRAAIDLEKQQLCLKDSGCTLPLCASPSTCTHLERSVRALENVAIPPHSEMEVLVGAQGPTDEGVWLLEACEDERSPVVVARALVQPKDARVPARLLNVSEEAVRIHQGTKLATLSPVETPPTPTACIASAAVESVTSEKREMLRALAGGDNKELGDGEKEKLFSLLLMYAHVFTGPEEELGRTSRLRHSILTGDAPPIRQAVRRIPPHRRKEVQDLLEDMLKKNVIKPSTSPWAAPIVLVKKKDGNTRFCVDYRKLNAVTNKDAYPLPRIDATLDTLAGSRWFSTLDLASGYWQVEIEKQDRQKTAFCTTEGLFEFKVMPFGLCNAPATFQRLMDFVLAGLQWSHCLVYIDDVIILGRDFETHLQNLQAVLHRLHESGLKVQPSKCAFLQPRVNYLGHVISREGIAADPNKIEKVASWPTPASTQDVQRFLGFANYYRRFIKDFAEIAKPLHRLTERTNRFCWDDKCQRAFDELRRALTSAPVLAFPDFSRPFVLDTDASDAGIGAVLSQADDEGRERVVAYGSRLLSKPERRYCVTRRELLAVVFFTHQFRSYLIGRQFVLRTDHGSLVWLKNFREPEGQVARWLERLQEFDFQVIHRRGKKHTNADALSRLPCCQCGRETHGANEIAVVTLNSLAPPLQGLRELQLADSTVGPVLRKKEVNERPATNETKNMARATRRLFQLWDQLQVKEGVLYRAYLSEPEDDVRLQMVVPESMRKEVLEDLHEGTMSGHLGTEKTLARVKERFYWPGHYNDVQEWCKTCAVCAARKTPAPKARAPLQSIKAGYPMQIVAMDILGPFPESPAGNNYILVVADYFSRWTEAFPIPNQEAVTVAKTITEEFFFRFSPPEQLHSDQGRQFESEVISETCKLLGINKTRTTPYHPQSDGLVERFNRTLLAMLAAAAKDHPWDWDKQLRKLCMAYNSSTHPTTGYTPFFLMFGRQVRMPIDVMYGQPTSQPLSHSEYATNLRQRLETAYRHVREQMARKLDRQKDLYDQNIHGKPFKEGNLVWLHSSAVPRGRSKKLHNPWTGPYKIIRRLADATYRIEDLRFRRNRRVVHFDRLKPCPSDIRLSQRMSVRKQPPISTAQPPGSVLEVVEEADIPEPANRYPRRQRAPPNYLQPVVVH